VWIIPATEISKAHDFSAKPINDPNVYIHGLFLSDSLLLKTALNENCSRPLLIQMTDVWMRRKDWSDVASSDMHPQQLLMGRGLDSRLRWNIRMGDTDTDMIHGASVSIQQERQPMSGCHQFQFPHADELTATCIYVDKDARMRTPRNQDMVVHLLR